MEHRGARPCPVRQTPGICVHDFPSNVPTAGMDGRSSESAAAVPSVRSSELLGYAADARVLIVNGDDLGMYQAIDLAIVDSIEDGIASSCSLMVPCAWALHAMRLLRQRPQIPFGIHLTLVCDTALYRWGPLTAKEKVPSLLDEAGALLTPGEAPELLAKARLDEVELEFRAQIDTVVNAGLTPTHLDFHCLADGGRGDILDLTVALASEYGLAVRVWLDPGRRRLRQRGLPVVDQPFLDSFSLDIDGKSARYAQLLRELPVGLNEWAVHPGLDNQESQPIDPGWRCGCPRNGGRQRAPTGALRSSALAKPVASNRVCRAADQIGCRMAIGAHGDCRRGQREVVGAFFSADCGDDVDSASVRRFGFSSHRPSDPILRPLLVMLARCSLATSHTMSQISRSLK